jgi:hypothetical protein
MDTPSAPGRDVGGTDRRESGNDPDPGGGGGIVGRAGGTEAGGGTLCLSPS